MNCRRIVQTFNNGYIYDDSKIVLEVRFNNC